jgi:hypothetical protein
MQQLRIFVAVAEELSFTRRAPVSQQPVSATVRRLERQLEVRLFDRTTRHVSLTAAGRAVLPSARAAVEAEARPFPRSRPKRLKEAKRRLALRLELTLGFAHPRAPSLANAQLLGQFVAAGPRRKAHPQRRRRLGPLRGPRGRSARSRTPSTDTNCETTMRPNVISHHPWLRAGR